MNEWERDSTSEPVDSATSTALQFLGFSRRAQSRRQFQTAQSGEQHYHRPTRLSPELLELDRLPECMRVSFQQAQTTSHMVDSEVAPVMSDGRGMVTTDDPNSSSSSSAAQPQRLQEIQQVQNRRVARHAFSHEHWQKSGERLLLAVGIDAREWRVQAADAVTGHVGEKVAKFRGQHADRFLVESYGQAL